MTILYPFTPPTSVQQLRVHPLRGSIFETWVASEILKHRGKTAAEVKTIVVHGGDTGQKRADVTVLAWDSVDRQRW